MSKRLIIIATVVVVIIAGAGGGFYFFTNDEEISTSGQADAASNVTVPEKPTEDTAGQSN